MALASLPDIALRGLVAAVPTRVDGPAELTARFGADQARRIAAATGIHSRRIASPGQCTSDLALPAARHLLEGLGWAPGSVDLLLVVSQTHDHPLPATACLMQHRLGLSRTCAALDVALGCSGYVYGLWTAAALLRSLRLGHRHGRALLLAGDTTTRLLDPADRSVAPLFGDAASATALEIAPGAPAMTVHLGTDGAGAPYLIVPGGGMRQPEGGRMFMDGTQVFAFTLREVPGSIAATLEAAGWGIGDVDHVVLHQANEMMLRRLGRKLEVPDDRLVLALADHGNTSSASIPLALASALAEPLSCGRRKLLLSGFGVGWSWATAAVEVGPLGACGVVEVMPDGSARLWPEG